MTPLRTLLLAAIDQSGLTDAEAARKSGMHRNTLSRIRLGREPAPSVLARVLDALGRDVALVDVNRAVDSRRRRT